MCYNESYDYVSEENSMDKCVLVVDDNDFNRELVRDILEDEAKCKVFYKAKKHQTFHGLMLHIIIYLCNFLTDEKFQVYIRHCPQSEKSKYSPYPSLQLLYTLYS